MPSLLSGLFCIFVGLFVAGFVFVSASYLGSYESIQLADINSGRQSDNKFVMAYQNVYFGLTENASLGVIPLFVFWSLVGAVSYMTVAGISRGLREIHDIADEAEYVHMDKRKLLQEEGIKFIVRMIALVALLFALQFTIARVFPRGRELAAVGAAEAGIWMKLLYCATAIIVVSLMIHVDVVLTRLVRLRVRLFGEELPEEATE